MTHTTSSHLDEVLPTMRKTGGYIKRDVDMTKLGIVCKALEIRERQITMGKLLITPQAFGMPIQSARENHVSLTKRNTNQDATGGSDKLCRRTWIYDE
jgi:hypothetical protein